MKTTIIALFTALTTYCQPLISATVLRVKDGDTIEVLLSNNTTSVLRLDEVDCPEKNQPYGIQAKQFTDSLIHGKNITYQIKNRDRYGRIVAKVYYNNQYLSAEIIKNGMGWWYSKYSKSPILAALQANARTLKIGLWCDPNPIEPEYWRKMKM